MFSNVWGTMATFALATTSSSEHQPQGKVTALYRHAVKGMNADSLSSVHIANAGETFPDDRRYALLLQKNTPKWNSENPEWLHKENFLCAFAAPQFFAKYQTSYEIMMNGPSGDDGVSYALPCDKFNNKEQKQQRLLTVKDRVSQELLLSPIDLSTTKGREAVGRFFSQQSGKDVVCVTADSDEHRHQFGNTSSGVKQRGDTRTVHIINKATVQDLSDKIGIPLNPTRFRPNIVIEGPEPWSEFDWIDGKIIDCGSGMKLKVIQKTVRCDGVSVDPLDPDNVLDIPKLLTKTFPQYGPYLGVYAVVEEAGTLSIGDDIRVVN